MKFLTTILAVAIVALPATAVRAGKADNFLKSMQGDWRGRGSLQVSKADKKTRVSCVLNARLDSGKRQLVNSGRCATAQGKSKVTGSIQYSPDGEKLKGVFFNASGDVRVTKSAGRLSGNTLVLSSTLMETKVGRLTRSRNIIRRSGKNKFTVSVSVFEDGAWKNRGNIVFKK